MSDKTAHGTQVVRAALPCIAQVERETPQSRAATTIARVPCPTLWWNDCRLRQTESYIPRMSLHRTRWYPSSCGDADPPPQLSTTGKKSRLPTSHTPAMARAARAKSRRAKSRASSRRGRRSRRSARFRGCDVILTDTEEKQLITIGGETGVTNENIEQVREVTRAAYMKRCTLRGHVPTSSEELEWFAAAVSIANRKYLELKAQSGQGGGHARHWGT